MPGAGITLRVALLVLLASCSARPPRSRVPLLDAPKWLDPSSNLIAHFHRATVSPILSALRLRGGMPLPSQIPHEENWEEERAREEANREELRRLNADKVWIALEFHSTGLCGILGGRRRGF